MGHESLDHFGEFVSRNLRDKFVEHIDDLVEISDGIHGEAFTEDGWYARFSRFGIHRDQA